MLLHLGHHLRILRKLFLFLVNLALGRLAHEFLVVQHAVHAGQLLCQALLFLLQALQLLLKVHQLRKGHIDCRLRNQGRYSVLADACLIRLHADLACIGQRREEAAASLKDRAHPPTFGDHVHLRLFAGRHVHGRTGIPDGAHGLLDELHAALFLREAPRFLIFRPGGNHDGFLSGQVAENFLCDKRHIGMQKLQGVHQHCL